MQGHHDTFPVGSRVRVGQSVIVYHYPGHRNEAFDLQGQEGEVLDVMRQWQGRPVSANLPILVKFDNKFRAHFQEGELEILA
ncbi:MAG TPA: ferredoxin-thioredoxin reductase variable chain [Thermosynechococcaceae cyanobacterium]